MKMSKIDQLCNQQRAFDFSPENESLFVEAMVENYKFQLERQPYLRYLAKKAGISFEKISSLADIYRIPPLFVGTMKIDSFCNIPEEELAMVVTSSGTGGQKTQAFFDAPSKERLIALANHTFTAMGFTANRPVHYFIMSYDVSKAANIGTTWSDQQVVGLAPAISEQWTIEWDQEKEKFYFDAGKWAKKFIELAGDSPVRLLGFPAFMYQMIEEVKKNKSDFKVHNESFVIAGGGWKNHLGIAMNHKNFVQYLKNAMGFSCKNIRDSFGMAEHGVPYCSCSEGHLHIPIYSRALIRDPLSLEIKAYGYEGLLQLFTPYNMAQANLSILSTDLAVLGHSCSCGIAGDYIISLRRGGTQKHMGCAIAAQEILERCFRKAKQVRM